MWNLSFQEFKACVAPEFFGKKDLITSMWWIFDMENAQLTSFFSEGLNMGFTSCLLRDGAHEWWEEVGHSLGYESVAAMSWIKFLSRFKVDFAPTIKV